MSHGRRYHRQSRRRDGASLVFGFFLSLVLVGAAALAVLWLGLFWGQGPALALDDEYCELVRGYVEEQATYYTLPTGIDPAVLEGVFTTQEVRGDVDSFVDAALDGAAWNPPAHSWEERLAQNVRGQLEASPEVASAYVADIRNIYHSAIAVPGAQELANLRSRGKTYVLLACGALLLVSVMLVATILRLHHFVHRGLRYLAYAVGASALMCAVVPLTLWATKPYKGIGLAPQYLYHVAVRLVDHLLVLCLAMAAAYAAVAATLCACSARKRKVALAHKFKHS